MMSYQEDDWGRDDWERDMNFTIRSTNNRMLKKTRYTMSFEKELPMVSDKYKHSYHHSYFDDDDANSSVTSGSVLSESGKFSEIDCSLIDLDDFMYTEPPPNINYDFSGYPGLVKQIVTSKESKQNQDCNDWSDDIDISKNEISCLNRSNKIYASHLNTDQFMSPVVKPSKSVNTLSRPKPRYVPEIEEDHDMSGLDFPDNLDHLSSLIQKKKSSHLLPSSSTNLSTRIPKSKASESKLFSLAKRENDDDDFSEGLVIQDKAFTMTPSAKTPQPSKSTKVKESGIFVSRLARPSPAPRSSEQYANKQPLKTKSKQQVMLSSRENEVNNAHYKNKTIPNPSLTLTMKRSLIKPTTTFERKSATGYTLIARPKGKNNTIKYCTKLDNIDNLNDLPSKKNYMFNSSLKQEHSWRKDIQVHKGVI